MQRVFIISLLCLATSCKSNKEEAQQEDKWLLSGRKIFTDKLNAFGLPDTTYASVYTYENFNVKDSSKIFTVNKYDNEKRLISKTFFLVRKESEPLLQSQSRYIYSGKFLVNVIDETNGSLTKEEKYTYDDNGKLVKSSIIRLKNFDKIFQTGDDKLLQKENLVEQGYDTLNIAYSYDANNKNIGAEMVDNRGNLIRKDVNIYSGASPITSYNLGPKGDTLQRISYVQQGNKITSQSENNDFIVVTAMNSGFLTGKLTYDKKKNEKLRQEWVYENGKLAEEKSYSIEKKKQ